MNDVGPARWRHRPALDGLRAVAVYLVVAYHAGLGSLTGGFIGVDLFFVLSGFVVTGVLITEHTNNQHIDLWRFYARRVRRLLPAAILVVVAVCIAAVFIEPPLTRRGHVADARSALLYFSNWHFIGQTTDYFAADDAASSPFLHFWSLSVEEQYYLLWPLTLLGILAIARRVRWSHTPAALVGVLIAIGVAVQLMWADRSPLHAYYGTDARVYQMLIGSLLAIVVTTIARQRSTVPPVLRRIAPATAIVALGALILAATNAITLTPSERGFVAAVTSAATIVALEDTGRSPLRWLLERHAIVYLGQISYGTYLWHWPVIVLGAQVVELSPLAMTVTAAVLATALAALSSELLEMPIRRSARLGRLAIPVVATGLTLSLIGGLVVVPAVLRSDRRPVVAAASRGPAITLPAATTPPPTTTTPATGTTPGSTTAAPVTAVATTTAAPTTTADALADVTAATVPPDLDLEAAVSFSTGQHACRGAEPSACTLVAGAEGAPHIFLLGDSNAAILLPVLTALAEDHGLTFSATTATGCPWQLDVGWVLEDSPLLDECIATRTDAYERVIPALQPDVVVTWQLARDDPGFGSADYTILDDALGDGEEGFVAATQRSLAVLNELGANVVMLEPVPYGGFNTVDCLSAVELVIDCAFEATPSPIPTEVAYRAAAAETPTTAASIDIDRLICPYLPVCLPIVNGNELVFRDTRHVYPPFLIEHREQLWTEITATDLVPSGQ